MGVLWGNQIRLPNFTVNSWGTTMSKLERIKVKLYGKASKSSRCTCTLGWQDLLRKERIWDVRFWPMISTTVTSRLSRLQGARVPFDSGALSWTSRGGGCQRPCHVPWWMIFKHSRLSQTTGMSWAYLSNNLFLHLYFHILTWGLGGLELIYLTIYFYISTRGFVVRWEPGIYVLENWRSLDRQLSRSSNDLWQKIGFEFFDFYLSARYRISNPL